MAHLYTDDTCMCDHLPLCVLTLAIMLKVSIAFNIYSPLRDTAFYLPVPDPLTQHRHGRLLRSHLHFFYPLDKHLVVLVVP